MTLDNLIRSFRIAVLGASLAFGSYVCGGDDSSKACKTDLECKGDRVCIDGYCEGNSGQDIKYTCESACRNLVYECKPESQMKQYGSLEAGYLACLRDCTGAATLAGDENPPWPMKVLECWEMLY